MSVGTGGSKHIEKHKNSDIGVQSFGHTFKTNQDIKKRNSRLTSSINSQVNDIQMTLKVFEFDPHRFAHLSNILNFCDVNLYNSLTFSPGNTKGVNLTPLVFFEFSPKPLGFFWKK